MTRRRPRSIARRATGRTRFGCNNLAAFLLRGIGVPRDPAAGLALYKKSCEAGDNDACLSLAFQYMSGRDTPAEPAKAVPLLRKACDGKIAQACGDLAYLYQRGQGVARDDAMALRLTSRGATGDTRRPARWSRRRPNRAASA
jgi:TPR repeat protein